MENAQLKMFIHLIAKEMALLNAHRYELGFSDGSKGKPPYNVGVVHDLAESEYNQFKEAVEEIYDTSRNAGKLAERSHADKKPGGDLVSSH